MRPGTKGLRWFRLLQGLWGVVLVLAIIAVATSPRTEQWRRGLGGDRFAALGLRTIFLDGQWRLDTPWVTDGDLAVIRRGDTLIAIDGRATPPVRLADEYRQTARRLADAPGPVLALRIRSPDGATHDLHLSRKAASLAQLKRGAGIDLVEARTLAIAASIAGQIVMVLTAALLFLRRGREPAAAFLAFGMLLTVMQLGASAASVALRNTWPNVVVYAIGSLCMFLGVLVFPDGRLAPPWSRAVVGAIAAWFLLDALYNAGALVGVSFDATAAVYGGGGVLFAAVVATQVAKYRGLPIGRERQQIRWAMFGFAASAPFLAAANLLVLYDARDPVIAVWLIVIVPALNALAILLLCSGLAISMLRYRLYDADAVISRSAGYAILTLGLAGVWAGAEKTLEVLFEGQFGHEAGAASAGVAAALAALLVTPAHHRVMHWTERVFQKQLARLRRGLPEHVGDLRETASVARLLDAVLEQVGDGVRARQAAVVLRNGKGLKVAAVRGTDRGAAAAWLKRADLSGGAISSDREDGEFPLRLPLVVTAEGPEVVGWLLLGPRPDGSFYGKDELDALKEVAEPIARAVHIARLREARETGLNRELKAIRAELAALKTA